VQGERVPFCTENETRLPCDICKDAPAVAVCHEDRAFLCRSCDNSIHSDNEHVAQHNRFLFTGVKLENINLGGSKKRKAANMMMADTTQMKASTARVSGNSSDFGIVPQFSEHFREEQQVPDAQSYGAYTQYPDGIADTVSDPFEQEFLTMGDKKKSFGNLGEDSDLLVSAFFDVEQNDFGVVPVF